MDSGDKTKPEVVVHSKGIAVETLGIIIGSAILGAAVAVSVMRAMRGGIETVSTAGLLSFLLTIGLSISAMVLAVVASTLSRTAEHAIAKKSEEISAMQTAMIAQTASAIERMGDEIFDTIYDNFEILAEEIQDSLPSRDVLCDDVVKAVERALAEAMIVVEQEEKQEQPEGDAVIVEEASAAESESAASEKEKPVAVIPVPEPLVTEPAADEMREKAVRKYGEFNDIVLLGISNYPGVIARKIGEGQYRTEGDELADGVFVLNNEKVAVCTFCTNEAITDRFLGEKGDSFNGFLRSLINEVKRGHFTRIFLVFDSKLTSTSPYAKALNGLNSRIDTETFSHLELFEGSPDIIIPELTERVSQLMETAAEEDVPELSFRRQMGA